MKYPLLALLFAFSSSLFAQDNDFPQSWIGHWKGELKWFRAGKPGPDKVNMELRIHPTDSAGIFTWQIVYNTVTDDNRPYLLKPKDPAVGHWQIDERNGIVLDQFWMGGKLCGAFKVQHSTIVNNYWMEGDSLMVEFFNMAAKPLATTGNGTDSSPNVDSYKVASYQKAILRKTN